MGFRCSLLGHDYDEPTTEEEREERGNEVVVTVRELETCARCGAETVISENTEVRSMDVGVDADATDAEPAAGEPTDGDVEPAAAGDATAADADDAGDVPSAAEDDAVILDDDDGDAGGPADQWPDDAADEADDAGVGPAAPGAGPGDTADDAAGASDATEATADAGEESAAPDAGAGGVEDGDAAATEPADDPDLDRNGTSESSDLTEWPDPGVEDEGFDAEPSSGDDVDVEFGGGLQPESATGDAEEGTEFVSASGTGITSTGPVERSDDIDTVLVCPECEFGAESVATSQRPGDICPDCRRGYLTERER